jgi:DNA 3'-phosphatase
MDKLENKSIIFIDLDSTLIETVSGKTFPLSIIDCRPIWKVWKLLKRWVNSKKSTCYIFIVSNQGGIERGLVKEEYFNCKINFISAALLDYIKNACLIVDCIYCPVEDKYHYCRKPNTGMLELVLTKFGLRDVSKDKMIMIGDASGKPDDFSSSDLDCAKNFNIDYLDVDDI